MDREVDLISPLITPLTYEGLIDDTVGIEKGRVRLDASVLGSAEQQDAMSVKMAAQSGAEAAAAAGKRSFLYNVMGFFFLQICD